VAELEGKAHEAKAFVFDLLGNSLVRFEQFDETTSLPYKSNGRLHLGGKIVTTPPDTRHVVLIIKAKGTKSAVIILSLSRYLSRDAAVTPYYIKMPSSFIYR
jgi:hypothetical protein